MLCTLLMVVPCSAAIADRLPLDHEMSFYVNAIARLKIAPDAVLMTRLKCLS